MDNDFSPQPRGQNTNNSYQPPHNSHDWRQPAPSFRTPDQVAAEDARQTAYADTGLPSSGQPSDLPAPPRKKGFKQRLKELTKKQWAIIIIVALLVCGGIGFAVYNVFFKEDPKPVQRVTKKEAPPPKAEPLVSTLTGLPISDPAINQRPVTAVMIENSPDARPQSGLNYAGVVFEAVAEGGITRFLTLFQDSEPEYLGPVRSVRPYYVQWLMGFDAGVAHVGGSADALQLIRSEGVKDLDQFANGGAYHRISSRYAPHNMYTNVVKLRELQTQKGYTSKYTGFSRKAEAKSAAPNAGSIDFNISGAIYNPHYDYDAASNSYKRSEGGKPHVDEKSGQQLSPKVVVALTMSQGRRSIYTTYAATGTGEAHIFQDGTITKAIWHKGSNKSQFKFTDANGTELKLNPGQTWLSVVGESSRISYR